ncbi:MAG: peptidyl-prolyl cis-trans isomerase [Myxococcales bacterium]|nr:peptidyl-prolyl cis-trans isomerase [Myxococcales bacterium]
MRPPPTTRAAAVAAAVATALACALCAGGCGGAQHGQRLTDDRAAFTPTVKDPSQVVARVGTTPILASDVRAQIVAARAQGKTLSRREALEQLITFELLAQEALRRGMGRIKAVRAERKRAMAAQLALAWREQFTPEKIPMRLVRRAYLANLAAYRRPVGREVTHIVVIANRKTPKDKMLAAARFAKKLRAIAASGKLSREEFKQLPTLRAKQAKKLGLEVRVENLVTARRGTTVRPFADATFALRKPGDISKVVQTRFGFHIIYLVQEIPARDDPLARVEHEVRQKVFDQARRIEFEGWLAKLFGQYAAHVDEGALAAAMKRQKTASRSKAGVPSRGGRRSRPGQRSRRGQLGR